MRLKKKILEKLNIPCPMCKKPLIVLLKNRFILKCDYCDITFAVGEIIKQEKINFCVYGNKCTINDPFTKKRRSRIYCRKYECFNSIKFCKRVCGYRKPRIKNY